jgi:branched-chain amino acid transport system substrate-binding protein
VSQTSRFSLDRRSLLGGAASLLAAPALVRAQAKVLKIAVLLPRSGLYAQAGQSCHRGALAAPKVLADLGYAVELVHVDIESNADTARTAAEKAITEGANCIVGAFDSGLTLAIAQVCEQRQVPLVINIAAAPQITGDGIRRIALVTTKNTGSR